MAPRCKRLLIDIGLQVVDDWDKVFLKPGEKTIPLLETEPNAEITLRRVT